MPLKFELQMNYSNSYNVASRENLLRYFLWKKILYFAQSCHELLTGKEQERLNSEERESFDKAKVTVAL